RLTAPAAAPVAPSTTSVGPRATSAAPGARTQPFQCLESVGAITASSEPKGAGEDTMDRQMLTRLGWMTASLLTTALFTGCIPGEEIGADETADESAAFQTDNGLSGMNGLSGVNGL